MKDIEPLQPIEERTHKLKYECLNGKVSFSIEYSENTKEDLADLWAYFKDKIKNFRLKK